jgi:hypothetical protein
MYGGFRLEPIRTVLPAKKTFDTVGDPLYESVAFVHPFMILYA